MNDLKFILRRLPNVDLAKLLGIQKTNISLWKKNNHVPKKHFLKLKEIKNELAKKSN